MGLKIIEARKKIGKEWNVWNTIILVFAGLVFLAVAGGLLYLAIKYRPACYVAFGFWVLALVVSVVPLPYESMITQQRPFAILCMLIAVSIVLKCFVVNMYTWVVGILAEIAKIGDGSCFFK